VPDRRRIVTISPAGTVTTVKDLEDSSSFYAIQDTFTVRAPDRRAIVAERQRRYGGAMTVDERHANGAISWQALVKATTVDGVLLNVEAMLSTLEQPRQDLYYEWRPDGATSSVYYAIRGPAKWAPTYKWAQFTGAKSMIVDIEIPVAPLARGDAITISLGTPTLPAVVALGTSIPGDAPALAAVTMRTTGGAAPPIWALFGWSKRPGTPLASSVAPFGIIEAETAVSLATWASFGADATYRGSSGVRATTAGAGTASASFVVDPSVLAVDDFAVADTDVEVWARVALDGGVVSPKVTLSIEPNAGTSFGQRSYSAEYGSAGKLLPVPSTTGVKFRFVKLGTLSMPVDTAAPVKWNVRVDASWATGSAGVFGLDYLVMVPARARALSPSGKPNDAFYPDFIASTSDTAKTIDSDLSGKVASGAANAGRDSGLGGSLIELPPGTVDVLVKLSSLVADDPTSDATTEQLSHALSSGSQLVVTPRYWLAKGA
jgi:hypothetical protein